MFNKTTYRMKPSKSLPQISLRYKGSKVERCNVTSSKEASNVLRKIFDRDSMAIFECFNILFMNRANHTIGWMHISQGGVAGTVVDCRLIFKAALDCLASGIILCHNHPSGNLKPSQQDIELTKRIKEVCKLLDIVLLDHIILAPIDQNIGTRTEILSEPNPYYSFADEGLL